MPLPPSTRKPSLLERKALVEAIAVVPPLVAATVAAKTTWDDPAKHAFGRWLTIGGAWLLVASVMKVVHAIKQDRKETRAKDHTGLTGALRVLHAAVLAHCGVSENKDGVLRATLHRVVPSAVKEADPEFLEQLVPYVGVSSSRGVGRRFSVRSGIIGRAVRSGRPTSAARENSDRALYMKELVELWGYTEPDAQQINSDRMSWMAIPLRGRGNEVVGVVYLDSDQSGFFTPDVQELIVVSCEAVATYIDEAY